MNQQNPQPVKSRRSFSWSRWGTALLLVGGLSACQKGASQESSQAAADERHVAIVDLRAGAPEAQADGGLFPLPVQDTHVGLIRALQKLRENEHVGALYVRLGGQGLTLTQSLEIGQALAQVRQAKIPVVCHAHALSNATTAFTLVGCDETWVSAAGEVSTVGIAAEVTYLKGAFDKLGIVPDMLAMGRYKSGGEALTREGPSEESAENLLDTLRQLREIWLREATGHQVERAAQLRQALEDGPWTPDKAKELGLIAQVGFEDEALEAAKKAAETSGTRLIFGPGAHPNKGANLAELIRLLTGAADRASGKERIALVPLVGSITMEAGGPFGESGIVADAAVRTLRRLREDDSVKAIVVRLDSPGGSPLASDLIWRQMMLTREKKPVIVSVGSMAASGGYYIACAGSEIIASEAAIVGSIGVFGGKIVLGPALEKWGVKSHAFAASPDQNAAARALHLSPFSVWDEPTRERVRESMQRIYDLFVERVAEGRRMEPAAVYATAEGAIFLSPTGKERGLIDELGGLELALQRARALAELPEEVPIVLEGAGESLLESLFLGPQPEAGEVEAALLRYEARRAKALAQLPEQMLREQLRPFAAALSPLLSGETVVTALPYSITVR